MLKPGYNIVEKDIEIAARLKTFRSEIRWQQDVFSAALGITVDKLSNFEAARTPIPYFVAWVMFREFGIEPAWLAYGATFQGRQSWKYPTPDNPKLHKRALLKTVSEMVEHGKFGEPESRGPEWQPGGVGDKLYQKLIGLEMAGKQWALRAPGDKVDELFERVSALGDEILASCPPEPDETVQSRREALNWAKVRAANFFRFGVPVKKTVDNVSVLDNKSPVPLTLKQILDRAKVATRERGMKRKLADFLRVAPPRLSLWLHGKQEPGAEAALRLLAWVTAEEAKQQKKRRQCYSTDDAEDPNKEPNK